MHKVIRSYADLVAAMSINGAAYVEVKGRKGILQSFQREDGSGKKFNVTLDTGTVFISFA